MVSTTAKVTIRGSLPGKKAVIYPNNTALENGTSSLKTQLCFSILVCTRIRFQDSSCDFRFPAESQKDLRPHQSLLMQQKCRVQRKRRNCSYSPYPLWLWLRQHASVQHGAEWRDTERTDLQLCHKQERTCVCLGEIGSIKVLTNSGKTTSLLPHNLTPVLLPGLSGLIDCLEKCVLDIRLPVLSWQRGSF